MNKNKIAIGLSLALFIAACGEKESAQSYIAEAKSYTTKNQYQEAIIPLKNALRLAPKDASVRMMLGEAYLAVGSGLDAIKEFEKAQELKYKGDNLIPKLARAYSISQTDDDILAIAGVDKLPPEQKTPYLAYKTLALVRTGQLDEATKAAEEAASLLPGNSYALLAQAYIEIPNNNYDKAESLVGRILSNDQEHIEALMLQAQVASVQGDFKKAANSYKKYEKLQPRSRIITLLLADTLLKAESYVEAEKYADAVLKGIPKQPIANYVKSACKFVAKDYQQASEFAELAIQSNYVTPQIKLIAGASAFHLSNFEQAHEHLSDIASLLVAEHPARKMLLISQFQLGLIDDLTESLDSFSPQTTEDAQFLSNLSFNLYAIGAKQAAKQLVEKSHISNDVTSSARQGILKLMMNDPSGTENLTTAIVENPNLEGAEIALAYAALQSQEYDKALDIANKWLNKFPEKAGSHNMLAAIHIAQNNMDLAKERLEKSLGFEPENLYALTELAKIHFYNGSNDMAKQFIDKALNAYPKSLKVLRYNFAIYKDGAALNKIKIAYQAQPENVELNLLYTDALINSEKLDEALEISHKLDLNIRTPKKAWQQRLFILKNQKKDQILRSTIEQWHKANPYHLEPVLLLADLSYRNGQPEAALRYINKALDGPHSESSQLKVVKVQLLLDMGELLSAESFINDPQFKEINPVVYDGLQGRIALMGKDSALAIKLLKPFYQAFPTSKNATLLALAYKNNNNNKQFEVTLIDHLDKFPNDSRIRMTLANEYLNNQHSKAIEQYKILVQSQGNNIVILNNLAWLTMEEGSLNDALMYSQKAIELSPEIPNVLDTRAMVLLKSGKKAEAWKWSSKAYQLTKGGDMSVALNYGEILLANGRNNEASILLKSLHPKSLADKDRKSDLISQIK